MTAKRFTGSVTCLICALLFGLVVIDRMATSSLAQTQGDPPIEQTRKNIQVLRGMPESQLFPVMNFISTSLAVTCDYCHVKNGKNAQGGDNWVWESDEKKTKLAGRRMIKMVLDINRTNFEGETRVTCYSCHRGNTSVARIPPLPPGDFTHTETAAALPTAEQVLANYYAAVGGKDAATKFQSILMKGSIERPGNRSGPLEVTLKGAHKSLMIVTLPQGVVSQGVNGDSGWIKSNSTGSQRLNGSSLEQLRRVASYYAVIKVIDDPAQMRVAGPDKIGDREAYVLVLRNDANRTTRFYFDTQTGLLLREITTTKTMLAPLPEQVDFEDYRDVSGIKLPFIIRSSDPAPFDNTTRRFTEIKPNVAVDDRIFNLTAAPQ
jgi:hypothetical protein